MKKLIVAVIIIAVIVLGAKFAYDKFIDFNATETAKNRVNSMLNNMMAGQEQEALCQWAKGDPVMSSDEMRHFTGKFDRFKKEKEIYYGVKNFDINDVELVREEGEEPHVRVSCTINGKKETMIVYKDFPIEWED